MSSNSSELSDHEDQPPPRGGAVDIYVKISTKAVQMKNKQSSNTFQCAYRYFADSAHVVSVYVESEHKKNCPKTIG